MKLSKIPKFYVRSGLFGALSIGGAVLNYALYPALVRILSSGEFGDFAAIVAISNQVTGILLAFNIISIYLVKSHSEDHARHHTQIIQKALIWLFVVATLIVLLFSPYLHSLLKIENPVSFIILAIILISAIPAIIWTGYLQGHKELVRVGVYNLGTALLKLITASALALKFGAAGGVLGLLISGLLGLFILANLPGVKLPSIRSIFTKVGENDKKFLSGIKSYLIECLIVAGSLSFLQNYDITLAKSLFSPEVAGTYSGVSVLSNALYFLSFLIIWIILPEIEIGNKKVNHRVLRTAYKLLGALSVATIAGELILKDWVAQILLGDGFSGQGVVLIFASLYQLTLVSATLYAFYLLINRQRRAILLAGLIFGCSISIPALAGTTPLEMIRLLWISVLVGVLLFQLSLITYRLAFKATK